MRNKLRLGIKSNKLKEILLSEEGAKGFRHATNGNEFNAQILRIESLHIAFGKDKTSETEFLSLRNALLNAHNRTNLAAKSYFARHADIALNSRIDVATENGGDYSEVDGGI